jgi:predicted  nucleic acid-binding Zn-ribbon protein
MNTESGAGPKLTVLESVECLECGLVYTKPTSGGTAVANPGCPDCGYVGWVGTRSDAFTESWTPPRSDAGHQPRPSG